MRPKSRYKARMHAAGFGLPALILVLAAVPAPSQRSAVSPALQPAALPSTPAGAKYLGPGSCAASACHGGIQPRGATKVLQNEYSTWIVQDRHSRAYNVLLQPNAQRIAQILNISLPEKSPKCLACHALSVPDAQIGRQFDISEGVSCESCHGPSSLWLGPHVQSGAQHVDMVKLGLVDTKDLVVRAEKCLTCHLGAPGMEVDHAMLAAGHPDLTFELDSFSSIEPPHWVERAPDQNNPQTDPLFGIRIWSVGQAEQLRESLLKLASEARGPAWPEFSELDCFTCHHSLTKPEDSWRQAAGYPDRRPGNPPYNMARYVVFRHFARSVDPACAVQLEKNVNEVYALASDLQADRARLAAAADAAARTAFVLEAEVRNATYNSAKTSALMRAIASDTDGIPFSGERSAEQATMALDSLYIAETKLSAPNASVRSSIDGLYKLVENPSAYNAPAFAAQMRKVRAALGPN